MKLKLSELKVQSFVTSLEDEQKKTINGAEDGPGTVGPTYNGNSPTGYPCPSCYQNTDGGTSPSQTSQAAGCGTYSYCGNGTGGTCSGMGTGYQCSVGGCYC